MWHSCLHKELPNIAKNTRYIEVLKKENGKPKRKESDRGI